MVSLQLFLAGAATLAEQRLDELPRAQRTTHSLASFDALRVALNLQQLVVVVVSGNAALPVGVGRAGIVALGSGVAVTA